MSVPLNINGVIFAYPETGNDSWGPSVTTLTMDILGDELTFSPRPATVVSQVIWSNVMRDMQTWIELIKRRIPSENVLNFPFPAYKLEQDQTKFELKMHLTTEPDPLLTDLIFEIEFDPVTEDFTIAARPEIKITPRGFILETFLIWMWMSNIRDKPKVFGETAFDMTDSWKFD